MCSAERLPNFFLVGAAKAGTTSLYRYLDVHPDVFMSPIKEPNYFSQRDMDRAHYLPEYRQDVDFDLRAYLDAEVRRPLHIADVARRGDYLALFRDVAGEVAIGEASNSYLLCPSAAGNIAEQVPDARVVMMLRNPVERAWSHFLMDRRLGRTLEDDFLQQVEADARAPRQGWGVTRNYLSLGYYREPIERFRRYFGRQRVLVLLYDDFQAKPRRTVGTMCAFLGVDPDRGLPEPGHANRAAVPRLPRFNRWLFRSGAATRMKRMAPVSWTRAGKRLLFRSAGTPQMALGDRRALCEHFAEEVRHLGELLERDLSHWTACSGDST